MPINGISIGKDLLVTIQNAVVCNIVVNRIKGFSATQKNKSNDTTALDGVARHANLPQGWTGNFEMERTGPTVDQYFAQLELGYYNGTTIPLSTIIETITEATGQIVQFQYSGCVLQLDTAG